MITETILKKGLFFKKNNDDPISIIIIFTTLLSGGGKGIIFKTLDVGILSPNKKLRL